MAFSVKSYLEKVMDLSHERLTTWFKIHLLKLES